MAKQAHTCSPKRGVPLSPQAAAPQLPAASSPSRQPSAATGADEPAEDGAGRAEEPQADETAVGLESGEDTTGAAVSEGRSYPLEYLLDLRSKLMMTEIPEELDEQLGVRARLDSLLQQLQLLLEMRGALAALHECGHVGFQDYKRLMPMQIPGGEVQLATTLQLLRAEHTAWQDVVHGVRGQWYFLNFFCVRDLLLLGSQLQCCHVTTESSSNEASAAALDDFTVQLHSVSSFVDGEAVAALVSNVSKIDHAAAMPAVGEGYQPVVWGTGELTPSRSASDGASLLGSLGSLMSRLFDGRPQQIRGLPTIPPDCPHRSDMLIALDENEPGGGGFTPVWGSVLGADEPAVDVILSLFACAAAVARAAGLSPTGGTVRQMSNPSDGSRSQ